MMKKLLLTIICCFITLPSLAHSGETNAVDSMVHTAVEQFEETKLAPLWLDDQIDLVTSIIDAINDILIRSTFVEWSLHLAVLNSLDRELDWLLMELQLALLAAEEVEEEDDEIVEEETIVTSPATPIWFPSTIVPFHTVNTLDMLVVWWSTSDPITNFRMTADGEDILIKELSLIINWWTSAYQAISSIALYDNDGNFIQQENVSDDEVTFDNLDLLVPVWSYNIYPVVTTRLIGYGHAWVSNAPFTLTLRIDDTEGMNSGQPVWVTNNYLSSKQVIVTPALINITMDNRDTALFLGKSDIAEFTVTSVDNDNSTQSAPGWDIDTLLQSLEFRVFQWNIDSATPPTFILSRNSALNSSNNSLVWTWDDVANTLVFDLASWSNDNAIINGSASYTVSVENITELNTSFDTTLQLTLSAGNPQAVVFGTDDPSYGSFSLPLFQDLESGWKTE